MQATWGRKGERKLFAKLLKINLRGQTWNTVAKEKGKNALGQFSWKSVGIHFGQRVM